LSPAEAPAAVVGVVISSIGRLHEFGTTAQAY
jgi:hypothetical protein